VVELGLVRQPLEQPRQRCGGRLLGSHEERQQLVDDRAGRHVGLVAERAAEDVVVGRPRAPRIDLAAEQTHEWCAPAREQRVRGHAPAWRIAIAAIASRRAAMAAAANTSSSRVRAARCCGVGRRRIGFQQRLDLAGPSDNDDRPDRRQPEGGDIAVLRPCAAQHAEGVAVERDRLDERAGRRPPRERGQLLLFLPPLRPAAAFCAFVPPWLVLLRRFPEPEALPPLLDEFGSLAMRAARDLLMPFLRSPSYCLSSLTLGPWSLAIARHLLGSRGRHRGTR
jgi:hypothetical protein